MIFDHNKPKLAFCNSFRDILANFQQFWTIPEILAIFLSWLLHLSSLCKKSMGSIDTSRVRFLSGSEKFRKRKEENNTELDEALYIKRFS